MAIDVIKTGTGEAPKELARLMFPNDRFTMAACLYRERFTIEVVAIAKNKGERDQTWAIRLDCLTGQGILEAKKVWSLLSRGFEVCLTQPYLRLGPSHQVLANAFPNPILGQPSPRECGAFQSHIATS
jgi:hypothetical protein